MAGLEKIVAAARRSQPSAARDARDGPAGRRHAAGRSAGSSTPAGRPPRRRRRRTSWPRRSSCSASATPATNTCWTWAQKLPHTFDLLKKVTPRIPGCMSEVYLVGRRSPASPDAFEFIADANAEIVRGLIALLQRLYSGQRAADVLAFDVEAFFRRIGLDQFITSQRRNGLAGMVQRIRDTAGRINGHGKKG